MDDQTMSLEEVKRIWRIGVETGALLACAGKVVIDRDILAEIRRSMALLQTSSEACALSHHGLQTGLPGWLSDTRASLDVLTNAIWPA